MDSVRPLEKCLSGAGRAATLSVPSLSPSRPGPRLFSLLHRHLPRSKWAVSDLCSSHLLMDAHLSGHLGCRLVAPADRVLTSLARLLLVLAPLLQPGSPPTPPGPAGPLRSPALEAPCPLHHPDGDPCLFREPVRVCVCVGGVSALWGPLTSQLWSTDSAWLCLGPGLPWPSLRAYKALLYPEVTPSIHPHHPHSHRMLNH